MDPQHSPEGSDSDSSEPWTLVDRISCEGDNGAEILDETDSVETLKKSVSHERLVEQKDAGVQVREGSVDVEEESKKVEEKTAAGSDTVEEVNGEDQETCSVCAREEHSQCCGNEGDLDTDGVSVISESDASEDYVHAGRYVQWQRINDLQGSFHSSDYFDLSAQPNQELPDGWNQFKRTRKYVHRPNKRINLVLDIFLALSLAAVVGLGIGHFLGLHEECGLPAKMDASLRSEQYNNIGASVVLSTLRQENDYLKQQLEKLSKAEHPWNKKIKMCDFKTKKCCFVKLMQCPKAIDLHSKKVVTKDILQKTYVCPGSKKSLLLPDSPASR